jgi:N-acetylglucosamine-6-sulfatase
MAALGVAGACWREIEPTLNRCRVVLMGMSEPRRHSPRTWLFAAALAVALSALVAGSVALPGRPEARAAALTDSPNVVVIQTDDQDPASFKRRIMPHTWKLLVKHGTRFARGFDASALCCPSRASLLTGQYPHNHGVFSDHPGYPSLVNKPSTLPAWLHAAGYRTAHIGKFLNGYDAFTEKLGKPAPGWSTWDTMVKPFGYYDYKLSLDGNLKRFGTDPKDYLDDVLTRHAAQFVDDATRRQKPFYLELDYWGPHSGRGVDPQCGEQAPDPAPRDVHTFDDEPLPRPPSFNEEDVSDKPHFIQLLPRLSDRQRKTIKYAHRCRLAALQDVDRGVRHIYRQVKAAHELDDTVFVYYTDNGELEGQHRVVLKKAVPYEEAMKTPYVIRLPRNLLAGGTAVHRIGEPVSNIDLAPTFLDLADAQPCTADGDCRTVDGRSLLPALRGNTTGLDGRAILVEGGHGSRECKYRTIRTHDDVYTEYARTFDPNTGQCTPADATEHYDLNADPFELQNLYPSKDPQTQLTEQQLAARLHSLQHCAGRNGPDACE